MLNLHIFEPRYKQMINECLESGEGFGVALIAEGAEAGDTNVLPHDVGSIAEILDVQPLPFGRYFISTVGSTRFRIREVISREPYLVADVDVIDEPEVPDDREVDELLPAVRQRFEEYIAMLVEFSGQESHILLPEDPQGTSYLIGDMLQVAERVKQDETYGEERRDDPRRPRCRHGHRAVDRVRARRRRRRHGCQYPGRD